MKARARKQEVIEEPGQFKKWCKENNGVWFYDKHMESFKCIIPATNKTYIDVDVPELTEEEFQELAQKILPVIFSDLEEED
jgi:hypothetical protein